MPLKNQNINQMISEQGTAASGGRGSDAKYTLICQNSWDSIYGKVMIGVATIA